MTSLVQPLFNLKEIPETIVSRNLSFKYLKDKELLTNTFRGTLTKVDFVNSYMAFKGKASKLKAEFILIDLREAVLKMSYAEIMEVSQTMISGFQSIDARRVVLIADKPMETAFAFSIKRIVEETCSICAKSVIVCSLPESGLARLMGDYNF
jgi:hypothetical protein